MILTDIAKEDFRKWIKENDYPVSLWALEDGLIWKSVEYALVSEWLDALPSSMIGGNSFADILYVSLNTMKYKEAIEHAIKISNEWYNSQHFAQ